MKLKNKALLTSALILALAFSGVNPVKASDDVSSDTSLESTEKDSKNQENVNTLKDDSQEKRPVYCEIDLYVKNRRIKDWLKKGAYSKIEGQEGKLLEDHRDIEKINIHENLEPGKKYKIEILDGKNGKAYAKGEINLIAEAKDGHKMAVEIIPNTPIKTRKMTLNYKNKSLDKDRLIPDGKFYVFVDGKFVSEYKNYNDVTELKDFEYETGKKFKIEFRRTRDADSELLASIEDKMPEDGKMLESTSMNVYLKLPTDPKEDKKDSEKGSETTASSGEKEGKKTGETSDGSKDNKKSNESKPSSNENSTSSSNDPSNGKPKNGSNQGNSMTVTPIPGAKDDKDKISEKSYKTREEAIEAAKKEMQTNTKWKSYYVIDQKDGTFKYGLSEKENNGQKGSTSTTTPNKLTTTNTQTQKPKSPLNVKTGVAGVGAVVGVLALSVIGYFVTKKKK
ncbi:DUF5633 domain-containing protein [Anaerococcus jeddahensis]|uniref:DUF5633 domain-containing protein n=1 Tax=Anaerococcus jeddahensis TaxID=1673719 RepID=UPI000A4B3B90|nr:DUF5633 domain-containing protein [Anaerococcus jeddahensis]